MRVSRISKRVGYGLASAVLSFCLAALLLPESQLCAQGSCTGYRTRPELPLRFSRETACSDLKTFCTANPTSCNINGGHCPPHEYEVTNGGISCVVRYKIIQAGDCGEVRSYAASIGSESTDCPDCSEHTGTTKTFSGMSGGIPESVCHEGCAYEKVGIGVDMGGMWAMDFKATGQSCSAPSSAPEPPGEKCITGSSGVQYCHNPTGGKNCGFLNGEFVCLKNIKNDGCKVLADGSRVCGKNAGTPPVPDNGTPGVPAEPDDVLTATDSSGTSTTYNYYNNTTVSGSSRDPGDTGAPQGTGSNGGVGDGSGVTDGEDGEGEGDGDLNLPGLDDVGTFGGVMSAFLSAAEATPIVSSLSGIGTALPAGSCPSYSVDIFDNTYTIEPMCDQWEDFADILSAIMLVGWGLLGVRILFSA